MAKKDNTRPKNLDAKIAEKLDEAFDIAEEYWKCQEMCSRETPKI